MEVKIFHEPVISLVIQAVHTVFVLRVAQVHTNQKKMEDDGWDFFFALWQLRTH